MIFFFSPEFRDVAFPGAGTQTLHPLVPPFSVCGHLYLVQEVAAQALPSCLISKPQEGKRKVGTETFCFLSFRTIPTSSHTLCPAPSCKGHLGMLALLPVAMCPLKNQG